ncbi:MAG: dienelactone hydrolase family protein, partial [Dongiaceae bacterium]
PMAIERILAAVMGLLLTVLVVAPAQATDRLLAPWPDRDSIAAVRGEPVTFPSRSPFSPADLADPDEVEQTPARATLFMPPSSHAPRSLPAVVMLHGSGGVLQARELTYGPQFAAMGVAALVVDAFAARRERGTGFTERLLNITGTMLIADAYAGLGYLAARLEIDPRHVALIGFSYGAMATMYALNAGIAERLAPGDLLFAGHVAFYGPCIARFADPRTTGAPLLMLYGDGDELIDPRRCGEAAESFRAGGSDVEIVVYPGAVHQWDGPFGRRLIGRNVAPCDFEVRRDGSVHDRGNGFVMNNQLARQFLLGLCVAEKPYPIGRDDAVRQRSNRDFGRFLARIFRLPSE